MLFWSNRFWNLDFKEDAYDICITVLVIKCLASKQACRMHNDINRCQPVAAN